MPKPIDIAYSRSARRLTIRWDDGATSELPASYLRGWCPCAGCQGHGTVITYQEPPDPELGIESMAEAGAYALHIRFSDGHDTGIYTWTWLYQLAPHSPPQGYKKGRFSAGTFVDASATKPALV